MKLIDIMKRYNRCILKENAKLRSIYNTLVRECGPTDECDKTDECEVFEDDEDVEGGKDVKEAVKADPKPGDTMAVADFLGEADKKDKQDKQDKQDECDACGDDSCKNGEKCGAKPKSVKEGDKAMDAKEFFSKAYNEGKKKGGDSNEDSKEGLMTAEEFFNPTNKQESVDEDDEPLFGKKTFYAEDDKDIEVSEEDDDLGEDEYLRPKNRPHNLHHDEPVNEEDEELEDKDKGKKDKKDKSVEKPKAVKEEEKEKKLSESLARAYRRRSRRLFNF